MHALLIINDRKGCEMYLFPCIIIGILEFLSDLTWSVLLLSHVLMAQGRLVS